MCVGCFVLRLPGNDYGLLLVHSLSSLQPAYPLVHIRFELGYRAEPIYAHRTYEMAYPLAGLTGNRLQIGNERQNPRDIICPRKYPEENINRCRETETFMASVHPVTSQRQKGTAVFYRAGIGSGLTFRTERPALRNGFPRPASNLQFTVRGSRSSHIDHHRRVSTRRKGIAYRIGTQQPFGRKGGCYQRTGIRNGIADHILSHRLQRMVAGNSKMVRIADCYPSRSILPCFFNSD